MIQVELPFELTLRVEQVVRPLPAHSLRSRTSGAAQGLQFIGVGAESIALSQPRLLETHWFSSPNGYVLGVQPKIFTGETQSIDVGALVAASALCAIPGMVIESVPTEPWTLLHDLRKTNAEFSAAVAFLNELSFLVAVLHLSEQQLEQHQSQIVEVGNEGRLRVRIEALQQVFHGESLASLASPAEKALALAIGDALLFDVVSLGIGSAFSERLKPYITFSKEVNISTFLSAVALALQLMHLPPPPPPPPERPIISVVVQQVFPISNPDTHAQSREIYRNDLKKGGIKAAQKYLIVLGFEVGKIDGVEGTKTDTARDAFCSSQGIVCTSVKGSAFQEALVNAMAKLFPLRNTA